MDLQVILSLLATTAASWFDGEPTQPRPVAAAYLALDALEHRRPPRRARRPIGSAAGAMPVPALGTAALAYGARA